MVYFNFGNKMKILSVIKIFSLSRIIIAYASTKVKRFFGSG